MMYYNCTMGNKVLRLGEKLPPLTAMQQTDDRDWINANPGKILASFRQAQRKTSGNWYVLGETSRLRKRPEQVLYVDSREILLVCRKGELHAVDNRCPHMGSPLSAGRCGEDGIVCAWHGLKIDLSGKSARNSFRLHDDGELLWINIPGREEDLPLPPVVERPRKAVTAVFQRRLRCDAHYAVLNRLDPWHGTHFHPHTFAALRVFREEPGELWLRVAYRVTGPLCVEVDARFHCPDARTIVMTIMAGEGKGSIVETHATPIAPGHALLTELVAATSQRPGFAAARLFAPLVRPLLRSAAARLWKEDAAYVERRYYLDQGAPYDMVLERSSPDPIGHPEK